MTVRPGFSELLKLAEPRRERLWVAGLLALVAHATLGFIAVSRPSPALPTPPPVEVEMTFREPPPPAPEPAPLPEAPEPARAPEPAKPVSAKLPPPAAARAGAVLTAKPDAPAPAAAEPFDFTSD